MVKFLYYPSVMLPQKKRIRNYYVPPSSPPLFPPFLGSHVVLVLSVCPSVTKLCTCSTFYILKGNTLTLYYNMLDDISLQYCYHTILEGVVVILEKRRGRDIFLCVKNNLQFYIVYKT